MPARVSSSQQGIGDAVRDAANNIADRAMQAARREVQQELTELQAQRAGLDAAIRNEGPGPGRAAIQVRIDRLDREIRDMERALENLSGRPGVAGQTGQRPTFTETRPPNLSDFRQPRIDPVPIIATTLGILFIAFPLALTISRYIWKRSTSAPSPALSVEQTRRFDRLEQSVDAIAIEIERISENQRYLTRVLADSKQSASVGSGSAVSK
jgi:hypothetical protein